MRENYQNRKKEEAIAAAAKAAEKKVKENEEALNDVYAALTELADMIAGD